MFHKCEDDDDDEREEMKWNVKDSWKKLKN